MIKYKEQFNFIQFNNKIKSIQLISLIISLFVLKILKKSDLKHIRLFFYEQFFIANLIKYILINENVIYNMVDLFL